MHISADSERVATSNVQGQGVQRVQLRNFRFLGVGPPAVHDAVQSAARKAQTEGPHAGIWEG